MLTDVQAGFRPYKRCVGQVAALCETISRWRGKYSAREENAAQPVPRDVDVAREENIGPAPITHQQSPSSVYLCFVDFQKAYDRVPHEALLAKLRYYGVTGRTYSFIETLYSRSVMQIRVGESLSEPVELKRGLRQGCPTSPILFSIYINDILPEGIWNKRITNVSSI